MLRRLGRRRVLLVGLMVLGLIGAFVGGALGSHVFSDVPNGAYYHDEVTWLAANGIVAGCGGGKYCPNDPITRGQAAEVLYKYATRTRVGHVACDSAAMVPYSSGQTWNNGSIGASVSNGLMSCNVNVPDDATIVKLSGVLYDDDETSTESCTLYRRNLIPTFGDTAAMGNVATTIASPIFSRVTDATIVGGQVDNDNYSYHVLCDGDGSTFVGTVGLSVEYTYKGVPAP